MGYACAVARAANFRVPDAIAARLLVACEERGISLRSGVSSLTVDDVGGVHGDVLSIEAVELLSVWLNVHPAWLAFGLGKMDPCPKEILVGAAGRLPSGAAHVELVEDDGSLRIRSRSRR